MNVLFLSTHCHTGGITSYIVTLARALVNDGHKVWVVSSGGDCVPLLESAGVTHLAMNLRTKSEAHPKIFLTIPRLRRLILKEKITVIHAQTRVTQVLGFFLSWTTQVPMITTCHGFFKPRWSRKILPCWGKAVIAISKPVAVHLQEDFKVPLVKIRLIANGIDLNRFRRTTAQQREESRNAYQLGNGLLIGVIARLSPVKGIDVLIQAMPLILKAIPSVSLVIAGQGPQEKVLKELTQSLLLTDHIQFKTTLEPTEKLLPAFDVFVMPSLMEGLGLSALEAQACGVPVIASKVGGLVDLIDDGRTGFLVPVSDPNALAVGIISLLKNPQHAQTLIQRARLNVERHFSAERMMTETVLVYKHYSDKVLL